MKTFEYYSYYTSCELAKDVENLMNDCGSPKSHLEKLKTYFEVKGMTPRDMFEFIVSCIGYWSETIYYDGRNDFAVLGCRKIVEKFPHFKDYCKKDNILLNAYGFTCSAHRYLQNEFFKTILEYFKDKDDSLYMWWEENEFVYNDDRSALIPYEEFKKQRGW